MILVIAFYIYKYEDEKRININNLCKILEKHVFNNLIFFLNNKYEIKIIFISRN